MSRCIQLVLSLTTLPAAACEHANEPTTPSVVVPAAEPTTTSSSSTAPVEAPPPKPAAKPVQAAPVCEQVQFQTRAGPRWVCKEPARVRVVKETK